MSKLQEIRKGVENLISTSKDENIVTALGVVLGNISEAETEEKENADKYTKLVGEYGKVVVKLGSKDAPDNNEEKTPEAKSLEEIIKDVTSKK